MKKNAFAIGVGSYEYLNILLSYYPRNLNENFDIHIFVDTSNIDLDTLKDLVKFHNIPIWNNSKYVDIHKLYELYADELNLKGRPKDILFSHGAMFKIMQPMYLIDKCNYEKVLSSDDDVFIFKDLSDVFCKYKEFAYKKESLFTIRTSKKYEILNGFNKIFHSDFSLERMNSLSLNSGNILSVKDEKLLYYFDRFLNSPILNDMYYNHKGYTAWTTEQRFHHFNLHRLQDEGKSVELIDADDVRLLLTVGKNHPERHLAQKTPRILHYAVGKKKPQFLREFLPRIEWKYDFIYETKYELKNKIFIENKLF